MKKALQSLVLVSFLMLSVQFSYAQFTATGKVTDTQGEPLIGATVLIKGTTTGTVTDIDGAYSLNVSTNTATLVVSYTGYTEQEMEITAATSNNDLILDVSAEQLAEVVVVGYGASRKEALTGSVTTVSSEKLAQVPLGSVEQTLQGNVAGLQAAMGNGQPGANTDVRIRGQGSIDASSEPLYVIDGIPLATGNLTENAESSNPLATLNPNDIESVTVLKDAASTAIYGSRGANGVILITTKSGRSGKAKIDFRSQVGFNDWAVQKLRGLTSAEYTDLYLEGRMNRGLTLEEAIDQFNSQFDFYPDPTTGDLIPSVEIIQNGPDDYTLGEIRVDTRWLDELSRTGLNQSYDLSVSGGNDVFTYFASGSYFKQEAPIIYSQLDRYSSRLNLNIQATKKLRITNNLSISRTGQQGMNDATRWANPLYNGFLLAPVIPVRDAQGRFFGDHKTFFMGGNNPIGSLSGDDSQEWTMVRILNNLSASYELAKGLTLKSAWSFDLLGFDEFYFRNARYGDGRNVNGFGGEVSKNTLNWIGTQTLSYATQFGESHNFDALLGYESNESTLETVIAEAQGFPNPQVRKLVNASSPQTTVSTESGFAFTSAFARLGYNYDYKYYLSGSVRRDGSSRFGINNRFGTFWSVGGSWRISQEEFLQSSSAINNLKLRASYGVTGNAGIGNFISLAQFGFAENDVVINYQGNSGGAPTEIGNQDLTWEQSKSFNVGLDFALFNRINGIIEYFNRESDNLLLDVPISRTTGFTDLTQNFGAMRNSGIELTLNADVIRNNDLFLSVGGNITFINNEITQLKEEFIDGTKIRREGLDFQTYNLYKWAGVNPDNGAPLWFTNEEETQTTSDVSEAELFVIDESATPDFFGGLNINLGFKGLSFDAHLVYTFGNYIYDATAWVLQGDGRFTPRSQTNLVLNRWRQPGDITDVPQFAWGNTSGSNLRPSTRYLWDGSNIRLRNITLAYDLPADMLSNIGLRSVRIYARGVNLWTWTKDKDLYFDPETAFSGVVNSPVPNLKTISFGLDIGL